MFRGELTQLASDEGPRRRITEKGVRDQEKHFVACTPIFPHPRSHPFHEPAQQAVHLLLVWLPVFLSPSPSAAERGFVCTAVGVLSRIRCPRWPKSPREELSCSRPWSSPEPTSSRLDPPHRQPGATRRASARTKRKLRKTITVLREVCSRGWCESRNSGCFTD